MSGGLHRSAKDVNGLAQDKTAQGYGMAPHLLQLAEANARLAANKTKQEVLDIQVKIEFQALIAQLFLQRRYQHVVIGTRFYRRLFDDGDTTLKTGRKTRTFYRKTTAAPPPRR